MNTVNSCRDDTRMWYRDREEEKRVIKRVGCR